MPAHSLSGYPYKNTMPKVKDNESRSQYVSRVIPILMNEGKTKEQAIGKAEAIYSNWIKDKRKSKHRGIW